MMHSIKVEGNHATISLSDKIYVHDATVLREELLEVINQGVTNIRIDISGLTYIDSSGLGTLVKINKSVYEKNGTMILTGAQGLPEELLKRTRLDKVFTIK